MRASAALPLALLCLTGCASQLHSSAIPASQPTFHLRLNQAGYLPTDPKLALLSTTAPITLSHFSVGHRSFSIGPDKGPWGPFPHTYPLDFSALHTPGLYTLQVGSTRSTPFPISPTATRDLIPNLLAFLRLQRCGNTPNPVTHQPCHLDDAIDTVTGAKVDLTGGWHDAGDRLKHMITTTYATAALYLAGQKDEADWGARLCHKLHPDPQTLYVQIGDDRDHLPPLTLWHDDQSDYGHGSAGPRSAWPALGVPQGPKYQNRSTGKASLAARNAAALALAGDLPTAVSCYRLAQSSPGVAQSIPVRAPYFYGEITFYDDLEWAATELYIATRDPAFLADAIAYADKAIAEPSWMGRADPSGLPARHAHYEFFPYLNLAHYRLYPHVDATTRTKLANAYKTGLQSCQKLANTNPYSLATPLVWCSTNDVVALATQALLYEKMTGDTTFRPLATTCRDWIFGRNPWGISFVINTPQGGAARSATAAHHPFYKLLHLPPTGGLVDGPVYPDINASLKFQPFPPSDLDAFNSDVAIYHNAYEDFSTNEPTLDGTVSLLLLLSLWN